MKFIELTSEDGYKILINARHIIIIKITNTGAKVGLTDDDEINVIESYAKIYSMLK